MTRFSSSHNGTVARTCRLLVARLLMLSVACASAQQPGESGFDSNGPQAIKEMQEEITRVSRLWHGCHVVALPDKIPDGYKKKGRLKEYAVNYWFSKDGRYGQTYRKAVDSRVLPDESWRLVFTNGEFWAQVAYFSSRSVPMDVIAKEGDFPIESEVDYGRALASGWIPQYRSRTEDLLAQYISDARLETVTFSDGESLAALVLPTRYGIVEFGFRDGRVRYVRTGLRVGTAVPDFESGESVFELDQTIPKFRNVVEVVETIGPIEYDADGGIKSEMLHPESKVLVKSDGQRVLDGAPDHRVFNYTVRPLKPGEFSLERIDVEAFGIPERLPALVPDSVVPYELRDGRLVKLVDARAQEVARESGFRRPSFWSRFRVFIIAFIAIVVGGVGWAIYRGRVE